MRTATLRLDHTPSTRRANSLLLQWDNVSRQWGASARLRWAWAHGRDLILALDRLAGRDAPAQTRVLVKLAWSLER